MPSAAATSRRFATSWEICCCRWSSTRSWRARPGSSASPMSSRPSATRWCAAIRTSSATLTCRTHAHRSRPGRTARPGSGRPAGGDESSPLGGVPLGLPALLRAGKLQRRAAREGGSAPDAAGALEEIDARVAELRRGQDPEDARSIVGELLFAAVALARALELEPEECLREANARFERLFRKRDQRRGTLMVRRLTLRPRAPGLHEFTAEVERVVAEAGVADGLCTLFVQHTSASLLIQENADPSAKRDLERWLERLVPPDDPLYTHTAEGRDDMPSHIRAALTAVSLSRSGGGRAPRARHLAGHLPVGAPRAARRAQRRGARGRLRAHEETPCRDAIRSG